MTSSTPLLSRIVERRDRRIGPVSPVPIASRMSEFSRRLMEKRLPSKLFLYDGCGPDGRAA